MILRIMIDKYHATYEISPVTGTVHCGSTTGTFPIIRTIDCENELAGWFGSWPRAGPVIALK